MHDYHTTDIYDVPLRIHGLQQVKSGKNTHMLQHRQPSKNDQDDVERAFVRLLTVTLLFHQVARTTAQTYPSFTPIIPLKCQLKPRWNNLLVIQTEYMGRRWKDLRLFGTIWRDIVTQKGRIRKDRKIVNEHWEWRGVVKTGKVGPGQDRYKH